MAIHSERTEISGLTWAFFQAWNWMPNALQIRIQFRAQFEFDILAKAFETSGLFRIISMINEEQAEAQTSLPERTGFQPSHLRSAKKAFTKRLFSNESNEKFK